jgi:SAM-dependent methyltransferase
MRMNKTWQKATTLGLRAFWTRTTFEAARDELVTSPPNPEMYADDVQDAYLQNLVPGLQRGWNALDYGCGVGRLTRSLLRAGATVTAVDVAPAMLDYTKAHCQDVANGNLSVLLTDGFGCPKCKSDSFDLAVCLYVLQHQPALALMERICQELFRCLRPGGMLIAQGTDHHRESNPSEIGFFGHRMSEGDYFDLLDRSGFAIQGGERMEPSQVILRAIKPCG